MKNINSFNLARASINQSNIVDNFEIMLNDYLTTQVLTSENFSLHDPLAFVNDDESDKLTEQMFLKLHYRVCSLFFYENQTLFKEMISLFKNLRVLVNKEKIVKGESILRICKYLLEVDYKAVQLSMTPHAALINAYSELVKISIKRLLKDKHLVDYPILISQTRGFIPPTLTYKINSDQFELDQIFLDEINSLLQNPQISRMEYMMLDNESANNNQFSLYLAFITANRVASLNEEMSEQMQNFKLKLVIDALDLENNNNYLPFLRKALLLLIEDKSARVNKSNLTSYEKFDLESILSDFLSKVFNDFISEVQNNEFSINSEFLVALSERLGISLEDLITKFVIRFKDDEITEIVKLILEKDHKFGISILENISNLKNRSIFFQNELNELLASLNVGEQLDNHTEKSFQEKLQKILSDDDISTIDISSRDFESSLLKVNGDITFSRSIDSIDVTLSFSSLTKEFTRSLKFSISFSMDIESLNINLIDTDSDLSSEYLKLKRIIYIIVDKLYGKIIKEQESTKALNSSKEYISYQPPPLVNLTRADRIKRYNDTKSLQRKRSKFVREATSISTSEHKESEANGKKYIPKKILDLDESNVQRILDEEEIKPEIAKASEIVEILQRAEDFSNVSKLRLGKPLEEYFGFNEKTAGIKIAQISWSKKRNALRIYLEDIGGGKFIIRGIFLKKSSNAQTRYITNLYNMIIEERNRTQYLES